MIKPTEDNVLVRVTSQEQKAGAIYMIGERNYLEGVVEAVGPDVNRHSVIELRPGDKVMFRKSTTKHDYAAELSIEGDDYLCFPYHYIFAKVVE